MTYPPTNLRWLHPALPLLLAMPLLCAACQQAPSTETLVLGKWQGIAAVEGRNFPLILHLEREQEGSLRGTVDSPQHGVMMMPLLGLTLENDELKGRLATFKATLELAFDADQEMLQGALHGSFGTLAVEFLRRHPQFRRFEEPRLDAAGKPVERYTYQAPPSLDDGWSTASLEEVDIAAEPIAALMQAILDAEYPKLHGILLAHRDRLVLEEYFYGEGRDRPHTIQSCTKSVNSLLVGIAIDRGLIDGVEVPVYEFFPEYGESRWVSERYDITLHDALTMSAGLDWNETLPYTDPKNDNTAMNASDDWIGYVLNRGQSEPSGERFAYTSGLSILLGGVVQRATGDYSDQFAEKVLFNHLGISDYQWSAAPDGTRHTGGGLSLRPRDFAKIGQLILNRGAWQGKQVVSEQWIEASTSHQTGEEDTPYGYQWWFTTFETEAGPIQAISAQGYGGQFLFVIPELDLVVAFTAGDFEGDGARPKERMEKFILPAVLGKAD